MFVRARLTLDQPREMLLVPERAVGIDQGQRFVYVVDGDSKVEYRKVSTGQVFDGKLAIVEGLKPHDRVITEGMHLFRPGQTVELEKSAQGVAEPSTRNAKSAPPPAES